jgi:lipoprotein-anchoring transpeptidase ErfK/SrfK
MLTHAVLDALRRRAMPFAAAALATVSVAALVGGPALAAAPTQLNAAVAPQAVVYPGSAVISGSIAVPSAALSLYARPAGAADWTPAGSTTAGPDGVFDLEVAPAVTTDYRVAFSGDGGHAAAAADVTVRVAPRLTTRLPRDLWLGDSVSLRGAVAPAHPGATVTIDLRAGGVWQPLATATLDAGSRFSLDWTPDAFGHFRLRARMDADSDHDAGVSAGEVATVNRPNAHEVPYEYAHYIVNVRHEYRLYYYEHGALVRRFDVVLGRPGYRTPLGRFRIYGKRRPAGGALGACAMFYRRKGGIAIHGTNQPRLLRRRVPRDFSHGCTRMRNRHALWLYARCPVGTRIRNLR